MKTVGLNGYPVLGCPHGASISKVGETEEVSYATSRDPPGPLLSSEYPIGTDTFEPLWPSSHRVGKGDRECCLLCLQGPSQFPGLCGSSYLCTQNPGTERVPIFPCLGLDLVE